MAAFHWRRHEQPPYQHIGLYCFNRKSWVTRSDSQQHLQILENRRQVLIIRDPHVMKLLLCVPLSHQFPGASRALRFLPVFLFPGVCILIVFLSPHLRILDWILAWVPLLFPGARITASFFFGIHRVDWIAQILRRVLPRTQRVVQHQIHGFRFRHCRIH